MFWNIYKILTSSSLLYQHAAGLVLSACKSQDFLPKEPAALKGRTTLNPDTPALCCSFKGLPAPKVSSYTFGSPRVGNAPFIAEYNLAVPDTWRITNSHDYAPTLPKLMGYCHVDHHVLLAGKARYSIAGADFHGCSFDDAGVTGV